MSEQSAPLVQRVGGRPLSVPLAPSGPSPAERSRLERRARVLAWGGIAWHFVEFAISVAAGVAAGSIALIGFGADSLGRGQGGVANTTVRLPFDRAARRPGSERAPWLVVGGPDRRARDCRHRCEGGARVLAGRGVRRWLLPLSAATTTTSPPRRALPIPITISERASARPRSLTPPGARPRGGPTMLTYDRDVALFQALR